MVFQLNLSFEAAILRGSGEARKLTNLTCQRKARGTLPPKFQQRLQELQHGIFPPNMCASCNAYSLPCVSARLSREPVPYFGGVTYWSALLVKEV